MRGFMQRGGLFLAAILIIVGLLVGVTSSLKQDQLQRDYERLLQEHHQLHGSAEGWGQELINAKIVRDRDEAALYTGFVIAGAGVLVLIFVLRQRSVHEMAQDLEDEHRESQG